MFINFSAISQNNFLGKYLRKLLIFIPHDTVLSIIQGPLFGKKWIIHSGVFGYWLGSYEAEKQKIFTSVIKPGDIVYDIGAHVGFYTLLACKKSGKNGKVFAFEPLPENIVFLKKHIAINHYNAVIVEKGVSDKNSKTRFAIGENTSTGSISFNGAMEIETIKLDDAILNGKFPIPNVVKMDIEGEEYNALIGLKHTIQNYQPIILLATHGKLVKEQCFTLLRECGYCITPIGGQGDDSEILATTSVA